MTTILVRVHDESRNATADFTADLADVMGDDLAYFEEVRADLLAAGTVLVGGGAAPRFLLAFLESPALAPSQEPAQICAATFASDDATAAKPMPFRAALPDAESPSTSCRLHHGNGGRGDISAIADFSCEDPIDLLDQFNDCDHPGGHVFLQTCGMARCLYCPKVAA